MMPSLTVQLNLGVGFNGVCYNHMRMVYVVTW